MTAPPSVDGSVALGDLRVGGLLAEGGEGRVYLLPRQPHLVYKAYRKAGRRDYLERLVTWPSGLGDPLMGSRVRAASAWPCSVVLDAADRPTGLLLPRAPRRFAVRHRDGQSRLASLSYLTADPRHRAAAYGLDLPPPFSPDRLGLVYALARLLAAFDSGIPAVAHGDLSTKNVLWSLLRGPEVFVIDCDNSDCFGADGAPADPDRRRAMTPNWDDPVVPRGGNPTPASDRYSLALVFLRVVGAANFPVQARQRAGGPIQVEVPIFPGPLARRLLDPAATVWDLCARGLSVSEPSARPPARAWETALRALLEQAGSEDVARAVEKAHAPPGGRAAVAGTGDRARTGPGRAPAELVPAPGDVELVPVRAARQAAPTWSRATSRPVHSSAGPAAWSGAGGLSQAGGAPGLPGVGVARPGPLPTGSGPPLWPQVRSGAARAARQWAGMHVAAAASLRDPARRTDTARRAAAVRMLVVCAGVDMAIALVVVLVVAVAVSSLVGS